MSSNNPFAFALNEPNSYVHHRDPPPPPSQQKNIPLSQIRNDSNNSNNSNNSSNSNTSSNSNNSNNLTFNPNYNQRSKIPKSIPPPRPPKVDMPPPPSYEEVAKKNSDYPEEKPERHRSSSNPSNDNTQNREPNRERSHKERSDRSREHRHRERRSHSESDNHKRRERTSKSSKDKKSPKKDVKPVKAKNLDTIDKMDVTAFFGGGFHHDGPFDSCTPHRNKNAKQPPVLAFPVDGPNNSISGLQKIDKNQQLNLAFGNYNDDDQNEIVGRRASIKDNGINPLVKTGHESHEFDAPQQNPGVMAFDSNAKSTPVHGSTTAGLGSTTFIDGAPAPIRAGNVSEEAPALGRKKSLVQRLRKTSSSEENSRRNSNDGTMNGENGRRASIKDDEPSSNSFIRRVKSLKVRR